MKTNQKYRIQIYQQILAVLERKRGDCLDSAGTCRGFEQEKQAYLEKSYRYARQIAEMDKKLTKLKETHKETSKEMPMPTVHRAPALRLSGADYRSVEKEA